MQPASAFIFRSADNELEISNLREWLDVLGEDMRERGLWGKNMGSARTTTWCGARQIALEEVVSESIAFLLYRNV